MVGVCRIFVVLVGGEECGSWHFEVEFLKLLEKWPVEIEVHRVVFCLPFVTMPIFHFVNFVRFFLRIIGNDLFTGDVARSFVEIDVVDEHHQMLLSAIETFGRFRNFAFLVEDCVFWKDLEFFCTGGANHAMIIHDAYRHSYALHGIAVFL